MKNGTRNLVRASLLALFTTSTASAVPPNTDEAYWNRDGQRCFTVYACAWFSLPYKFTNITNFETTGPNPEIEVACCGNNGAVTKGRTKKTGGDFTFTANYCGVGTTFKTSYEETWTASTAISWTSARCECVTQQIHQDFAVFPRRTKICATLYGEVIRESDVRDTVVVPLHTRLMPAHYIPSPPCQGCPAGSNQTALNDPNYIPKTAPIGEPKPSELWRPWDETDGDLPTVVDAAARARATVDIDLANYFAERKIESTLDLTLAEIRVIVSYIRELRALHPTTVSAKSNCVVRLDGDSKMVIRGKIGSLESKLRKTASIMVASPSYGDFDGDEERSVTDVGLLQDAVQHPEWPISQLRRFDLNGDDRVDADDILTWIALDE